MTNKEVKILEFLYKSTDGDSRGGGYDKAVFTPRFYEPTVISCSILEAFIDEDIKNLEALGYVELKGNGVAITELGWAIYINDYYVPTEEDIRKHEEEHHHH